MSPALEAALQKDEVPNVSVKARARRARPEALPVPADNADHRVARNRRLLNVAVAALMLVLLAPLMLLVALAVALTSRGPVIYSQTRVGLDRRRQGATRDDRRKVDYGGKLFTIYKFRTMAADPDSTIQIWAQPNDSRVTRVGRVLRKYRLDELPQLYNVIRGDMNLVGPRPEQPNIFLALREEIDRFPERQRVLPGITGSAQVSHHYGGSIEDAQTKLYYDLAYIRRQSVLQDLMILLRTVPVVVFQKGAW